MAKKKKPGRRRTEYDQKAVDRICKRISLGQSLRRAMRAKNEPSISTFMEWMQKYPKAAEQYAQARARGIELHIDGMIDLADTANSDNAHAVRLKVDVRKWIASKIVPKVYGDRGVNLDAPELPQPGGQPTVSEAIDAARRLAFHMHHTNEKVKKLGWAGVAGVLQLQDVLKTPEDLKVAIAAVQAHRARRALPAPKDVEGSAESISSDDN